METQKRIGKVESACELCGVVFSHWPSMPRRFCSRVCTNAARRPENGSLVARRPDPAKHETTVCPTCGKEFSFLRSWPRKYCSNTCKGKANIANIGRFEPSRFMATCQECGAEFEATPKRTRGRFCSQTCFGNWLSKNNRGENNPKFGRKFGRPKSLPPPMTKQCPVCGTDFVVWACNAERRVYCSRACQKIGFVGRFAGENSGVWCGGYEPYYGPSWFSAQRAARERDGVCQDCGKSPKEAGKELDVHHVTAFGEFGRERHEEANRLSNLVTLCAPCHLKREWSDAGRVAKNRRAGLAKRHSV